MTLKTYIKTWKIIAGASAITWRELAAQAKADPKLAALMKKTADSLTEIEKHITSQEEGR